MCFSHTKMVRKFWIIYSQKELKIWPIVKPGNTKGGSITVPLTSCLTGLDQSVLQIKTKIVSSHTANSKPVKQEVNSTVIFPPVVFPGETILQRIGTTMLSWFHIGSVESCFGGYGEKAPPLSLSLTPQHQLHHIQVDTTTLLAPRQSP